VNNENEKIATTEISVSDTKEEFLDITETPSNPPLPINSGEEENTAPIDSDEDSDEIDIPISIVDAQDEIEHKHTNTTQKKKKQRWTFLLFLAVNVIVVAITAMFEFGGESTEDTAKLKDILSSLSQNWYFLGFALMCFLGIYLFQVLKISEMIRVTTGLKKTKAIITSVIIGKYYDNITPLAIGGQPFQAYYLSKNKIPVGAATAAPIVQLFLGNCAFITLSITAFIFGGQTVDSTFVKVLAYIGVAINALIPAAIVLFSVFPNITGKIASFLVKILAKLHIVKNYDEVMEKTLSSINEYRSSIGYMWKSKRVIILGYILSLLEKLSEFSITYFVLLACGLPCGNYFEVTALTLFIYAATSFVPTPGTAGASEGTFYIVFGSFWPMFIWRIFSYYSYLFFGFVTILYNGVKKNLKNREKTTSKK